MAKQFCKAGHDTFSVGRRSDGTCRACGKLATKKSYYKHHTSNLLKAKTKNAKQVAKPNHREKNNQAGKRWRQNLREVFFLHYGFECQGVTGTGDCTSNGIQDLRLLTVAHYNNDGALVRKKIGRSHVLEDLRRRDWPDNEGIGVQCYNCQWMQELIRRNTQ